MLISRHIHTSSILYPKEKCIQREASGYMIYKKAKRDVRYVEVALQQDFHDISGIWYHGGARSGIYEKYFFIHPTRNLTWSWSTHNDAKWPKGDPIIILSDTVYDFAGYKQLWWNFLNVDDKEETHYTKLKFSTMGIFQRNQQCNWFQDWW